MLLTMWADFFLLLLIWISFYYFLCLSYLCKSKEFEELPYLCAINSSIVRIFNCLCGCTVLTVLRWLYGVTCDDTHLGDLLVLLSAWR